MARKRVKNLSIIVYNKEKSENLQLFLLDLDICLTFAKKNRNN